jgi:hypothetical protein
VRRADEAVEHHLRTEDVRVHDQHRPVERVPRRPQREDRTLAEARVGHTAHVDAEHPRRQRGAHEIVPEAGDHHRLAHAGGREAIQQPEQQAAPGDLDQTLRRAARRAEETLANAGGEDDRAAGASAPLPAPRGT